jgi:solute carrier family 39 (zinc transporter), member 1/2/3
MIELKLASALFVLLAGVLGGLFASRLLAMRGSALITSLANTFAGGVFLGAALLHMFPEASDHFHELFPGSKYPLFALVGAVGFLGVLLMDKVVMSDDAHTMTRKGSVYPYVLMLTLSIHSLVTGTAMGLEAGTAAILALLVAVLFHKATAAMALSISFSEEGVERGLSTRLLAIFYTTTPIGIVLGTWFSTLMSGDGRLRFEAVFDALAAGTFFYIAVVDILAEEFAEEGGRWRRWGTAVLGFATMAVLAIWS